MQEEINSINIDNNYSIEIKEHQIIEKIIEEKNFNNDNLENSLEFNIKNIEDKYQNKIKELKEKKSKKIKINENFNNSQIKKIEEEINFIKK